MPIRKNIVRLSRIVSESIYVQAVSLKNSLALCQTLFFKLLFRFFIFNRNLPRIFLPLISESNDYMGISAPLYTFFFFSYTARDENTLNNRISSGSISPGSHHSDLFHHLYIPFKNPSLSNSIYR